MGDIFNVSVSKIRLARKCMKAYDYKYNQQLSRKRKAVPLLKGLILHDLLNARAKGKSVGSVTGKYNEEYRQLFQEETELYGTMIDDMLRVYEAYCRHYEDEPWTYECSEIEISMMLSPDIRFVGYIDKVVRDKQDRRFTVDHKTSRSLPNEEAQFSDLQQLMYVHAWNYNNPDEPVDGIIWDYLRSKPPTIPDGLKDGSLSKRQIDTDFYTYTETIRQARLKPTDYEETLNKLRNQSSPFFKRVVLPTPAPEMVAQVVQDIIDTAKVVRGLKDVYHVRNLSRDCAQCEFYSICQAELRGHDSNFVRKNEYVIREEKTRGNEENEEGNN